MQRQKEQEEEWARQEALRIKKQEEEEAAKLAALQQATPDSDQNRYDLPPEVSLRHKFWTRFNPIFWSGPPSLSIP